jgi:pullulanase
LPLKRDARSGVWSATGLQDLTGHYYTYLVDVLVPGVGLVRNRVTDPYALSLSSNSRRTWIGRLDHPALKPAGWETTPRPRGEGCHRRVIYELHVRDFSASDTSVRRPGAASTWPSPKPIHWACATCARWPRPG